MFIILENFSSISKM